MTEEEKGDIRRGEVVFRVYIPDDYGPVDGTEVFQQ